MTGEHWNLLKTLAITIGGAIVGGIALFYIKTRILEPAEAKRTARLAEKADTKTDTKPAGDKPKDEPLKETGAKAEERKR